VACERLGQQALTNRYGDTYTGIPNGRAMTIPGRLPARRLELVRVHRRAHVDPHLAVTGEDVHRAVVASRSTSVTRRIR
jgi:hypothetical protein